MGVLVNGVVHGSSWLAASLRGRVGEWQGALQLRALLSDARLKSRAATGGKRNR